MYQAPPQAPRTRRSSWLESLRDFLFLLMLFSIVISSVLLVANVPEIALEAPFDWLPLSSALVFALQLARFYARWKDGPRMRLAVLWLSVLIIALALPALILAYRAAHP